MSYRQTLELKLLVNRGDGVVIPFKDKPGHFLRQGTCSEAELLLVEGDATVFGFEVLCFQVVLDLVFLFKLSHPLINNRTILDVLHGLCIREGLVCFILFQFPQDFIIILVLITEEVFYHGIGEGEDDLLER